MYGRAFLFVALVVLGAVLPYILADDASVAILETWWNSLSLRGPNERTEQLTIEQPTSTFGFADLSHPNDGVGASPASEAAITTNSTVLDRSVKLPRFCGPPGVSLEQLLSFEITPDWITSQWARVSTRLSDLTLQGWRVPFAIGSRPDDLAGSLTYCFDRERPSATNHSARVRG